jgi:hypothetical protein
MTEVTREEVDIKLASLETRLNENIERTRPRFFQRNAPVVSALAAVVSLGVVFWFYVTQVGLTQRQLQNNLIYQMQKDQRSAVMDYSSGHNGPEYIIAQMQSVFIQRNLNSVPDDVWPVFLRDFCSVLRHENFKRSWEDVYKTSPGAFSADFVAFMGKLEDPNSSECKNEGR